MDVLLPRPGPGAGSVPAERAKDDLFDAQVLAGFVRTDHAHLMVEASSEATQELKLLTADYQRQVRTQT